MPSMQYQDMGALLGDGFNPSGTIDPSLLTQPTEEPRPQTSDSGYASQNPWPETDPSIAGLPDWFDFDSTTPTAFLAGDYYYQTPMINAGAPLLPAADDRGIDFNNTPFHQPPAFGANADG
ncbi:MAG: hypothetical protein Q9196_005082, partial [Gyalolechia fulgens]